MTTHGYHFLPADRRLLETPHQLMSAGAIITNNYDLDFGFVKLGVSAAPADALRYADGPVIASFTIDDSDPAAISVSLQGDLTFAPGLICDWLADGTLMLHQFSIWSASRALAYAASRGLTVEAELTAAIQAKQDWLDYVISDSQLQAAFLAAQAKALFRLNPSSAGAALVRGDFWEGRAYALAAMWCAHRQPHSAARSASRHSIDSRLDYGAGTPYDPWLTEKALQASELAARINALPHL